MSVPVVVLTGVLGAGKTTLLNRLLARRAAAGAPGKIGVIVNELGAIGIDGDLLAGGARQVELPGGCVCCVLGDELDRTVIDLIASQPGLDAIVLETTGVAEPLPIAWAFEREPLAGAARLAAVVTLVDATRFCESRALSPSVDAQVRHADALILTKRELVDEYARTQVLAAVRELAPDAPLVEGATDAAAAWLEELMADIDVHVRATPPEDDDPHDHDHGVDSVWVPVAATVDLEELEDRLAELPANYIRIKGIARAVDPRTGDRQPRWVAFHRVGLRVSSEVIGGPAEGRAVALGPGVERARLAACIDAAVLSSPA